MRVVPCIFKMSYRKVAKPVKVHGTHRMECLKYSRKHRINNVIRLKGKVNAARQIEPEIFPGVYGYLREKKSEIDRY